MQLTPIERYAMKFVEESEGAFSAAQLAAAERELEEQKKEWELDRLRALREEEERRMRLADDDEKPLTFGREDAQNQVNSASNSKKLVNKKLPPNRRRNSRKNISKSAQESESETETTTESESESQEDVVLTKSQVIRKVKVKAMKMRRRRQMIRMILEKADIQNVKIGLINRSVKIILI